MNCIMKTHKLLSLLLFAVSCMFMTSCSNDEELEPKGKYEIAYGQNLIGKWVDDGSTYVDTYVFLKGGRGYRKFAYKFKDIVEDLQYFSWEYVPESRIIKILFDEEKEEFLSGDIPSWAYSRFQVKDGYLLTPDNDKCYKE